MALPPAYAALLNDLNREVMRAQPEDVLQFCASFLFKRLEEERRTTATGDRSFGASESGVQQDLAGQYVPQEVPPTQQTSSTRTPVTSPFGKSGISRASAPGLLAGGGLGAFPPTGSPTGASRSFKNVSDIHNASLVSPSTQSMGISQNPLATAGSTLPPRNGRTMHLPSETGNGPFAASSSPFGNFHMGSGGGLGASSNNSMRDLDAASDDSNDDHIPPPPMPSAYNFSRRTSVSAESMAPAAFDDPLNNRYEKIVIPKSHAQRSRIEASISNNFLFKNLDEEQYHDVLDAMSEKKVARGTTVIEQGAVGDYFYIVETGSFEVLVSMTNAQGVRTEPRKVHEYGPGGSFGELALMYNAPRAATVVATSTSVLWALDRMTFRRILMEHTAGKRRMYESFLEEVPLLVSLEPYERQKIADALESSIYDDGQAVIRQGDSGAHFFIIESGSALVKKRGVQESVERVVGTLHKGDYFGELALLNDAPRAATVVAQGRLKVASLGKKAFTRLLGPVHTIIRRNAHSYGAPAEND